jgi:hypothetical protein
MVARIACASPKVIIDRLPTMNEKILWNDGRASLGN